MKPGRARAVVDYLCESYRISIRGACGAYPLDRSTYHYRSRRPDQAPLRQRIREIAKTRVRYGYRRVHVLLRREGWSINHKRTRRLYREEGLQLRNKNPKRSRRPDQAPLRQRIHRPLFIRSIGDHASDALAVVHEIKAAVDLFQ